MTDNPNVPIDVLVSVFKSFLAVNQTPEERDIETQKISDLASEIEEIKSKELARTSAGFPASRNHPRKLASKENDLKQTQLIKKSRDNFRPGNELHPELKWMASRRWHRYSKADTSVDIPTMMELMESGFIDFWDTHNNAIQTRSQLTVTAKAELSEIRKKVAKKGSASRDHEKWLELTKNFCKYARKNQCKDYNHMLALRGEFLSRIVMDPRTKAKKEEFLGTLINLSLHKKVKINYDEVVSILNKQEIKNVSPNTIEESFKIIDKALKR